MSVPDELKAVANCLVAMSEQITRCTQSHPESALLLEPLMNRIVKMTISLDPEAMEIVHKLVKEKEAQGIHYEHPLDFFDGAPDMSKYN